MTEDETTDATHDAPDLTADDASDEPDAFSANRGLSYRFDDEAAE